MLRQKCSVQSRPAEQPHGAFAQVEVASQYCLDVASVVSLFHRVVQLDNTAKLITAAIVSVGQDELRVVLNGHGFRLRLRASPDCEPEHKKPGKWPNATKVRHMSLNSTELGRFWPKIGVLKGRGAQKQGSTICNIQVLSAFAWADYRPE